MAACSSQEKFNVTSYDAMAFVIITLQTLAGTWINGFIVCVLCVSWVKKKVFNSNEKILLFLGSLRFGDLCISWAYSFTSMIYPHCYYVYPIPQIFSSITRFLDSSNVWASASLCVFYCLKIANFQHTFFIYLKVKIDRIVPWLLFGSVLFALIMGILGFDITERTNFENFNSTESIILGTLSVGTGGNSFLMLSISVFISTTAFMVAFFSTFLLLFSLWRHKCRMQANSMRNLNVDAHIKAIKSILFFIFLYSINFIGFILILIDATKKKYLPLLFILLLQYGLPVVHSLVLIFSNTKLEKTLLRTLPCCKWKFHKV
ncbi:taste receptor type 2 member 9-like [Pogoniulus pusillus]|uniref:taste receptor type 2 member 9-like n=1 Tax=Pogoniulus pusillus TaxID=488313 RepID=UPI0030B948BB